MTSETFPLAASTLVLMDCPGGLGHALHLGPAVGASTLVLMDCPGGRRHNRRNGSSALLQPLF